MNTSKSLLITILFLASITACTKQDTFDASGTFEAEETIISSEANGVLTQFSIDEGSDVKAGQIIGYVDSTQLVLQKQQVMARISAILSRKPEIAVQLAALKEQLSTAENEKKRIGNLVASNAATTKQLDDIKAQIRVIKKQIDAQNSALRISSNGISLEVEPLQVQVDQLNDQLAKCRIVNPVKGTVLNSYTRVNEMTAMGKPLYKVADLSTMILRAYVSGNQLSKIRLNESVQVKVDDGNGGFTEIPGEITWISDKAEFTPKTIQTKDERANRVYAIKVSVKNDGTLKIGMYGELIFKNA